MDWRIFQFGYFLMTGFGISYWDHISNICVWFVGFQNVSQFDAYMQSYILISITIIWFFFLLILYIYKHHCFNSFAIEWPTYQKYLMYFFFSYLFNHKLDLCSLFNLRFCFSSNCNCYSFKWNCDFFSIPTEFLHCQHTWRLIRRIA